VTAGAGEHVAAVRRSLNSIVDPCSAALGVPSGLVDMGLVQQVDVSDGRVVVSLLPTGPGCVFLDHFETEIEQRLGAFEWCSEVRVQIAEDDLVWDETRLSSAVRQRLAERRRAARLLTGVRPRGGT